MAAKTDVVVTMLPGSVHVRECYSGSEGVLQSARKESLFIDCSTIDRETVLEVVDEATQAGASFLDAPVSGGRWVWFAGVGVAGLIWIGLLITNLFYILSNYCELAAAHSSMS